MCPSHILCAPFSCLLRAPYPSSPVHRAPCVEAEPREWALSGAGAEDGFISQQGPAFLEGGPMSTVPLT